MRRVVGKRQGRMENVGLWGRRQGRKENEEELWGRDRVGVRIGVVGKRQGRSENRGCGEETG